MHRRRPLSVSAPANANEGNAGTQDRAFTVRLSQQASANVICQVCFSGTATIDTTMATAIPAGADYQPLRNNSPQGSRCLTDTILSGNTFSTSLGIRVKGDTDIEPDETVAATLSLSGTVPAGVTLGTGRATHTILSEEKGAPLTLSYGVAGGAPAPEGSMSGYGGIVLNVKRALTEGEVVTVPLTFSGVTSGTDFTVEIDDVLSTIASAALSGDTVTITGPVRNDTRLYLRLFAAEDVDEVDEVVTVSIGTATSTGGSVTVDRFGNGQITLFDNDIAQSLTVEFTRAAFSVGEGVRQQQSVLRLSAVPRRDIEVPVTVTDGTAVRGEKTTVAMRQ